MFTFFTGNLTEKRKRKYKADEIESIITQNGGKVIKDFGQKFPTEILGDVITIQREIDKEEKKLTKGILTAYRRKWRFLSPEFVMQYEDADIASPLEENRSNFQLNLRNLQSLPSSSVGKVTISNIQHHMLDNRTISAHRIIKKTLREKHITRKPKPNKENVRKGVISGYSLFVKENYQRLKKKLD